MLFREVEFAWSTKVADAVSLLDPVNTPGSLSEVEADSIEVETAVDEVGITVDVDTELAIQVLYFAGSSDVLIPPVRQVLASTP